MKKKLHEIYGSTGRNDWILDPFAGSSTTGIAANICGRRFLGIEQELEFAEMGKKRRLEIDNISTLQSYRNRLNDLKYVDSEKIVSDEFSYYGPEPDIL